MYLLTVLVLILEIIECALGRTTRDWSSGPVGREGGSRAFQRPDRACLPAGWQLVLWRFAIQSRVSLWGVLISQYLACVLLRDAEVRVQAQHTVQCGLIHRLSWLSTWLCKTSEAYFEATDGLTFVFIWAVLEFHYYLSEYSGQLLFASVLPWAGK